MQEITFQIEPCSETGGYVARWDDAPGAGGISTQGETLDELQAMIADAVEAFFEPGSACVPHVGFGVPSKRTS